MKPSGVDEGRRWMAQAERDLDAAELLAGGKHFSTRYPNGLPGGIPSSAYSEQEAQDAMRKAREILRAMAERMR